MNNLVINQSSIQFDRMAEPYLEKLAVYFENLSAETKKRFAPHPFDLDALREWYLNNKAALGFIAIDQTSGKIIAYAVVQPGFLTHDGERLASYGLPLSMDTDCTFAPSVADQWQGVGLGKLLFQFLLEDLKQKNFKRIILWGGVQATNLKAIRYYNKLGFEPIGQFHYNELDNYDMILKLAAH